MQKTIPTSASSAVTILLVALLATVLTTLAGCDAREAPSAPSTPAAPQSITPSPVATLAPAVQITAEDYRAAAALLEGSTAGLVKNASVTPNWLGGSNRFWYRRDGDAGDEYVVVDSSTGEKVPAFDLPAVTAAVRAALPGENPAPDAGSLKFANLVLSDDLQQLTAAVSGKAVSCDLAALTCTASDVTPPVPGRLASPSGKLATFSRNDNLFVVDLKSGKERQLTTDGAPYFSYGKLPDSALMAIQVKKRGLKMAPVGAVFSPDERYLLVPRIDERKVAVNPFVEWVPTDGSLRPILHEVRSQFTGDRDTLVSDLFVFDLNTGKEVKLQEPADFTQGKLDSSVLGWSTGRGQAFLLGRTYGGQELALVRVDLATGQSSVVIKETSSTRAQTNTVEYNRPNIRILGDGDEVVWYTDRNGWGHLELYDAQTGNLKNAITSGEWLVQDIHQLDEKQREVYFTAGGREAGRDPYFRHLYKASLDGGAITLLTDTNADHHFATDPVAMMAMLFGIGAPPPVIRPDLGVLIDTSSTVEQPPVTVLRSTVDGHVIATLETADASGLYATGWKAPQRQAVKAADGVTDVYTVYYPPLKSLPGDQHPVIDAVYGGPQVIVAPRNFIDAYSSRNPGGQSALARLGFAVVTTDGRGTPLRSSAFRDAGYTEFTQVGIDDHIAAIEQLAQQHPEMDTTRVGVYGWSWGGTFSGQAILSRPEFYDVAVSGAGVYDYIALYPGFENSTGIPAYDDGSIYRSRPDEKPANYQKLDINAMAGNLKGKLMIVYGDMDENVPQLQAFRLVDALIKANKPYDLLYLPNRTHGGGGESYTLQRKMDYFVEHLLHTEPPSDVVIEMGPRH